jgi:DNA-binding MarR family transcriptional regulator
LQPLPEAYVRVPLQWLTDPSKGHVFEPEARLFLLVLYRSHWGQKGVQLTDAVAAEVGVAGSTKRQALNRLERKGWVRVERHERLEAPVVWPIIVTA